MGIDAGFDMVPRLSKGAEDQQNWQSFIKVITETYQNDDLIELKENFFEFNVGEHPKLPLEGHKFLRFSSKISGSRAEGMEDYIDTVRRIAREHFGSRVHYWNEGFDGLQAFYGWREVNESLEAYKQPGDSQSMKFYGTDIPDTPPFETVEVPGKGKGLVARFNISKGTCILSEQPSLATPELSPISLSPCGDIYHTVCLINHSCLPNAYNSWNPRTHSENIHAIRDIRAGEEITITYVKAGPSTSRHAYLKNAFGFDCACEVCSLPLPELQLSDQRRVQIQHLNSGIRDPDYVLGKPDAALADCFSLLQLLDEEFNGDILIAKVYYDAFQICMTHGDQARASYFARMAYDHRVICEGPDHPAAQMMETLMINPAQHWTFGASTMWKTELIAFEVTSMMSVEDFEKWLWRQ